MAERFLIALDGTRASLKTVRYLRRVLGGRKDIRFWLFHVLRTASPNLLRKEEIARIEALHEEHPHLSGYFWSRQQEENMREVFEEASQILLEAGFSEDQIRTHFAVESDEVAQVIVARARALGCSTVVVGRRGLSRVKEFFLGSVSKSVIGLARGMTVWVVDE